MIRHSTTWHVSPYSPRRDLSQQSWQRVAMVLNRAPVTRMTYAGGWAGGRAGGQAPRKTVAKQTQDNYST